MLLVPKKFKINYLNTLNLRDIMVCDSEELLHPVKMIVLESKNILKYRRNCIEKYPSQNLTLLQIMWIFTC